MRRLRDMGCPHERPAAKGNGARRSPSWFWAAVLVGGVVLSGAPAARAQIDLLLRHVDPVVPQAGRCGQYHFEAHEPDGDRRVDFTACITRVAEDVVELRLESSEGHDVRVVLDRAAFAQGSGELLRHIVRVEEVVDGHLETVERETWRDLPALAPLPDLPVEEKLDLGTTKRVVGTDTLVCRGRRVVEARSRQRQLGGVDMQVVERRSMEVWTAPRAPILGVVRAVATTRSERRFAQPIPGVPARGPREATYRLELRGLENPAGQR